MFYQNSLKAAVQVLVKMWRSNCSTIKNV